MNSQTLPPSAGDPLADSVNDLLGRLKHIAPEHPVVAEWFTAIGSASENLVDKRLCGVVGSYMQRQTDRELRFLDRYLRKILTPRLVT